MRQRKASQEGQRHPHSVEADISWLSPTEGGRKNLPTVTVYRTVPRFEEDPNGVRGTWDMNVEFLTAPSEAVQSARVSFVSEAAPHELLHSGSRFELTEGRKVVARGRVRDHAR